MTAKIEMFLILCDGEEQVEDSVEIEGEDDEIKGLYAELKATALADVEGDVTEEEEVTPEEE